MVDVDDRSVEPEEVEFSGLKGKKMPQEWYDDKGEE